MFEQAAISDIPEFKFGHAQNHETGTGCTVVIAPDGATCGVDVRGGGPATRETDLLRPENMVEAVHAVVLSGGSAYGLEASCGVTEALAKRGIGFSIGAIRVPIVTSACLFDLFVGKVSYPGKAMGIAAAEAAFAGHAFREGNVGCGTGASVGKLLGQGRAMKAGFGMCFLRLGVLTVGALVGLNALGNIQAPDGSLIAGCRDNEGRIIDSLTATSLAAQQQGGAARGAAPASNTTLGVIVTNAFLTKAQATKVSSMVHDAYARAIKPVHCSQDGDAVFTFASGAVEALPDTVAVIASEAMQQAIYRAALHSQPAYGLPSAAKPPLPPVEWKAD